MAIFNGTPFDDMLTGSAGNDTLNGGLGDDLYKYTLGRGNDMITDTGGFDTLQLDDPNGLFDNWKVYRSSSDLVFDFYGQGRVTVANQFFFSGAVPVIETLSFAFNYGPFNVVNGFAGTTGADLLVGTDRLGMLEGDTLSGGGGNDLIFDNKGNDTVYGGDGNDELYVGEGDDIIYGQAGDDEIYADIGKDVIDGGAGWDSVYYVNQSSGLIVNLSGQSKMISSLTTPLASGGVYKPGSNSSDTLVSIEGIEGSSHQDTFYAGSAANNGEIDFQGGAGSDTFYGGGAYSYMRLGYFDAPEGVIINLSNTTVGWNGDSAPRFSARDGWGFTDSIVLSSGQIALSGSDFSDYLRGRDDLSDYWLSGGRGDDVIDGGNGDNDTAAYDNDSITNGAIVNLSAAAVTYNGVTVAANCARDGFGNTDRLVSIESVEGSSLNDYIVGSSANNRYLSGRDGNDNINAGAGNDYLSGGNGNDVLNGGTGADDMDGGNGSDTYFVDHASDTVSESNATSGSGGVDLVNSYLNAYSLGSNVENGRILSGNAANLTGNGLSNVLYAGSGNNTLNGGGGVDTASYQFGVVGTNGVAVNLAGSGVQVTGGSGSDILISIENITGSNFADSLTGNGVANRLTGGLGKDVLTGNGGNDIFDFNALAEMGTNGATADIIKDFNAGDKIDLSTLDANTTTTINDAFTTFIAGSAAFTAAGQLKFNTSNHVLYGNTDADVGAEFAITLTGVTNLTVAAIIL